MTPEDFAVVLERCIRDAVGPIVARVTQLEQRNQKLEDRVATLDAQNRALAILADLQDGKSFRKAIAGE
jgi:hypothetical protein